MRTMFVVDSINLVRMGLLVIVIFLKRVCQPARFGRGVGVGLIVLGGARTADLLG